MDWIKEINMEPLILVLGFVIVSIFLILTYSCERLRSEKNRLEKELKKVREENVYIWKKLHYDN